MNLEQVLFDVSIEVRKAQLEKQSSTHLLQTLKAFESALKKSSQMDRAYIIDMFYGELARIKYALLELKEFQGFHDRIFNRLLGLPKKMPKKITLTFQEFIKGITYFEYQKNYANDIPIYHRLYSCGDGTELYRNDNIICHSNITRAEKNRRKKLAERCYIERLIYDALFRYDTLHFSKTGSDSPTQDEGHMFRLDITRQDYESCFKGCKIAVEIEWIDGMPCVLKITRSKNNQVQVETYRKSFSYDMVGNKVYEPIVECEKTIEGKKFTKLQSFKRETDFKKVVKT